MPRTPNTGAYRTPVSTHGRVRPNRVNLGRVIQMGKLITTVAQAERGYAQEMDKGNLKSVRVPQLKNMPKRGNGNNMLVGKTAMKVQGKTKVKRAKRVKLSNKFVQGVKQVLKGQSAHGRYTRVMYGFVGTLTGNAVGAIAGDDLNDTQFQVYYNSSGLAPGRTLFNQLVTYVPGGSSTTVPGTGLNHFTMAKILDAASVLFNEKLPSINPYNTNLNLSTFANGSTGVPGTIPGKLMIDVVKSYAQYTMKNLSKRVMTVEIWECTPTLKIEGSNALTSMVVQTQAYSGVTSDTNFLYAINDANATQNFSLNNNVMYEPKLDPLAVCKSKMGYKWTWKKRTLVMGPQETCVHSIQGPSGMFDFTKINTTSDNTAGTAITTLNSIHKGCAVSVVISVVGDLVLPVSGATKGGRKNFIVADQVILGAPIAIEVEEMIQIRVPEVAGFINANTATGLPQQLNLRKAKDIFWSHAERGGFSYVVNNEENPAADAGYAQTI